MSSRDAREPSFVTFVVESTLSGLSFPESVSWFFDLSNFFTLPWIALWRPLALEVSLDDGVELADVPLVSVEPERLVPVVSPVADEPVPMLEEEPVDEPLLPPIVPWLESRLVSVEPEVLPPLPPLCASAWPAMRTTAAARPKPHPIFFISTPFALVGACCLGAFRARRTPALPLLAPLR